MPVACSSIVHSSIIPAVLHPVQHRVTGLIMHHLHRVAHAARGVTVRHHVWVETVCHTVPGAIMVGMLALPQPYTAPAAAAEPLPVSAIGGPGVPASVTPHAMTDTDSGPTPFFFSPSSTSSDTSPTVDLTPLLTTPSEPPIILAHSADAPDISSQAVPEPGSASVLGWAVGSLILVRRKRRHSACGCDI